MVFVRTEAPVVPLPRGREVWRLCRDRSPSPNSIQRTKGNATTHIPTAKTKRMPAIASIMLASAEFSESECHQVLVPA